VTATPFALVSSDDHDKIVAYATEDRPPSGEDVVTFQRDANGLTTFGVHRSVETAHRRFGLVTPVDLVRAAGCDCPTQTDAALENH
jgi:hypothetical protein